MGNLRNVRLIVAILLEATYLWSRFRKVLDQRLPDAYRRA